MENISKKALTLVFTLCLTVATAFAQDIIVMRNSTEIKAKIRNIGQNEITYSKWSNQDGPTYTINKSEVRYIQYANGEKDVFENTRPTVSANGSYSATGNYSGNGSYSAANTGTYGNTGTGSSNIGSYTAGGLTGAVNGYSANNSKPAGTPANENPNKARFRGYFYGEAGYSIVDRAYFLAPVLEMGVFCGGNTFIGVTTGFKYFPDFEGYFIPVNATARFYFTRNRFAPFADASVGIAIGNKVVFNARLGIGFNAGKFSMGVGYERLYQANVPYLRIGFNFGK